MSGLGWHLVELPLLLLVLRGFGPLRLSHFHLTEVPALWVHLYSHWLPSVALATFHQVSLFATTSTCFTSIWHHLAWIPHMTWECSHLVWISLWLVAIGCHLVLSVAILTAGVGKVVAPWHGHNAQHIPNS